MLNKRQQQKQNTKQSNIKVVSKSEPEQLAHAAKEPDLQQQWLERIEQRLDGIEQRVEQVLKNRTKSLEWVGVLSEQIESLDEFREEVRLSFEPVLGKINNLDELIRIIRHASCDLSKRLEHVERLSA